MQLLAGLATLFCYCCHPILMWAHRNIDGWCGILQAGRLQVQVQMKVNYFSLHNPSTSIMALDFALHRNEYHKISLRINAVGVWSWQPSCHLWTSCLDNVGSSSHTLSGIHGILQRWLYLSFTSSFDALNLLKMCIIFCILQHIFEKGPVGTSIHEALFS